MKLVLTLLVRDEEDIVDAHLAFHLNAGVDFAIVTNNRSQDGTAEILDRYARAGYAHVITEDREDLRQDQWVTRMARLAATDFGADWVINSDADEFWWPRGTSLKEVLEPIPRQYAVVRAAWRSFPPRPGDEYFAERMTVRLAPQAPINDPTSPFRPQAKIIHRAHPDVVVGRGNHTIEAGPSTPLRGWYPAEVLHFPVRSLEQCERKNLAKLDAWRKNPRGFGTAYQARAANATRDGRIAEYYDTLCIDDEALERGVADGSLAVDTRLRDALRTLRGRGGSLGFGPPAAGSRGLGIAPPSVADDAAYAVDVSVLAEADEIRIQRRLDELDARLVAVESRLATRLQRSLRRLMRAARPR